MLKILTDFLALKILTDFLALKILIDFLALKILTDFLMLKILAQPNSTVADWSQFNKLIWVGGLSMNRSKYMPFVNLIHELPLYKPR